MRAPAEPVDAFYATVRLLARFWIWFLFRRVAVRGADRVPPVGPVLLCINHPNNLVDSLLVGTVLPRKVHYLATATLFRNPLLARFLDRAGAIPVARRQDGDAGSERNADTFAACQRALDAGRLLAIYPEGRTHAEMRVQQIRTGAARIALAYESEGRGPAGAGTGPDRRPLALVPVGLSFGPRRSFRHPVLVAFGEPLALAPFVATYRDDPPAAVRALTAAIQSAMEAEVVHLRQVDVTEMLRAVETLYRDDLVDQLRAERGLPPDAVDVFRLSRTIAAAVEHFRRVEPDRVERLWRRIQRYRTLLAAGRIRDQAVRARLRGLPGPRPWRSWRAVAGLPLFLYGVAVNALPYLGPRWLARGMARKETDYATVRVLASVVSFPLGWGLETWAVARAAGPGWAVLFAASLPLSGLAAWHYLGGLARLSAELRLAGLLLTHRRRASRLLAERRAIVAELERAKTDFLAAGRPPPDVAPVPVAPGPLEGAARDGNGRPVAP
jgi:1-acyl-sn-glycerol-3-phosphate acyltransferase